MIKLQVTLSNGTHLCTHFEGVEGNHAEYARMLMERGLRAQSLELVIKHAIADSIASLPLARPQEGAPGEESAEAAASVDDFLDGVFDDA